MNAKVSINFGQNAFKFMDSIKHKYHKQEHTQKMIPYKRLAEKKYLDKFGVYLIKEEQIEDY